MWRKFCGWLLRTLGWTAVDPVVPEDKCIILGVPHTSIWDFVISYLYYVSVGGKPYCMIKGELFWGCVSPKRDWQTDKYTTAAKDYAQKLFNRALTTANDSQLLSEMNYNLCNFKTVAEKYPDTELGILVRGSCDKLVDYKVLFDK